MVVMVDQGGEVPLEASWVEAVPLEASWAEAGMGLVDRAGRMVVEVSERDVEEVQVREVPLEASWVEVTEVDEGG